MEKIIITIDGSSSCGKSTLAKQLAKVLGYVYIDSGAMYRAITLYFLRNNVDINSIKDVKKALQNISVEFKLNLKAQFKSQHQWFYIHFQILWLQLYWGVHLL